MTVLTACDAIMINTGRPPTQVRERQCRNTKDCQANGILIPCRLACPNSRKPARVPKRSWGKRRNGRGHDARNKQRGREGARERPKL